MGGGRARRRTVQSEGTPIEQSIPSPAQQVVVTEAADCAIEAGVQPPPRPPRPPCRQGGIIAQSGSSQSELPSPSLSWRSKHSAPLSVLGSSVSQPGLRAHGRRVSAVRARPGGTRAYRLRGVGGEFPRRERKREDGHQVSRHKAWLRERRRAEADSPAAPSAPARHARRCCGAVRIVAVGRSIAVVILAVAALAHRLGVRVVGPASAVQCLSTVTGWGPCRCAPAAPAARQRRDPRRGEARGE